MKSSRGGPLKRILYCLVAVGLVGCASESIPEDNLAGVQRIDEPIAESELRKFLRIVSRLPDKEPPTFSPLTDSFYVEDPAEKLIQECRIRFEKQFDIERQGKIWKQNRQIRQAAAKEKRSTTELAGLMTTLSTAICRAQFDSPQDLRQIEQKGVEETSKLKKNLDRIDANLAKQSTTILSRQRTELAMKLSRTVALVEYLKVLQRVPDENIELVKRYQEKLTSLVDQSALDNLDPKSLTAAFD